MSSGLKKQDGKKIAFVVHVTTTKEEKEKDHTAEERHVITKAPILVAERLERKHWLEADDLWQSHVRKNNGRRKAQKEPRWKDVTNVFHEAGVLIKERKASWTETDESRNEVDKITRTDCVDGLRQLTKDERRKGKFGGTKQTPTGRCSTRT